MEGILKILAILVLIAEVILFYRLRKNRNRMTQTVRITVLFAIILIPIASIVFANYHVFVGMKETKSCVGCHVMAPMGNDLVDPQSQTLAARHFKNGWIQQEACYSCHEDYGFTGTIKGKLDGYRHLMRYMTNTYHEPIRYRGEFNNQNCLNCHNGTEKFHAVQEHIPVLENIANTNSISCMNCHGRAHPEPSKRTPGHPEYERLDKSPKEIARIREHLEEY
ncbi:hypothetical protein [Persicobacter diffluens]|uniref:NapC/NirT cytochrome c N-terminal domain-containing protein n=1 Tax=Persicobacter diffluens TaxID=981 RepID=A0AAN5ALB9_9BACT|nr:hypothetical protein PEDI_32340 [Persicobacter diffluens]